MKYFIMEWLGIFSGIILYKWMIEKKTEMKKYQIDINYIKSKTNYIVIGWSAKNIGFGELTIDIDKSVETRDEFIVDTECMSKKFYEEVMEEAKKYIIKNSIIVGEDK